MIVLIAGDRVRIGGELITVADVYYADRGRLEITDTTGKTWYASPSNPAHAVAAR